MTVILFVGILAIAIRGLSGLDRETLALLKRPARGVARRRPAPVRVPGTVPARLMPADAFAALVKPSTRSRRHG
jgi:hypothetical protein